MVNNVDKVVNRDTTHIRILLTDKKYLLTIKEKLLTECNLVLTTQEILHRLLTVVVNNKDLTVNQIFIDKHETHN